MSLEHFIAYLQELLTMINPDNPYSVALAKNALTATAELAIASKKADVMTLRCMHIACTEFNYLANHAKDFAGKPGKYAENENKRRRLLSMIQPGC